ncbi:putative endo-beta-1,4-glucanase celB [Aspergillus coremiiformis]|uniref:Glucanase n=1 Tax=Aspergillus coremiiformis TaxID=138285 RepID=A0A5N6ZFK6_9EURO|nr:putative endo-beta-1,4-glucanase celB [Aspergillus coremiiformis]
MMWTLAPFVALLPLITAQQVGTAEEVHPQLTTYRCTSQGGCTPQNTSVVLDASAHFIHKKGTQTSCTNSNGLDKSICPDKKTCADNCVLEGISDYARYGVQTYGDTLALHQYLHTNNGTTAVTPRVYLLAEDGEHYSMLKLLNQEFTFDVDASTLVCGMNGALYLSEMAASGGKSALNPAGAKYGTGYCDAQCYATSWINGEGNTEGVGSCCQEMDIWEANARATAFTPHPCDTTGLYECSGPDCSGSGVCDKSGCAFNPYALGAKDYYGYGLTVNTNQTFTVVTQFLTTDNTATGQLKEIRRIYVQNGQVIQNVAVTAGGKTVDSITKGLCNDDTGSAYNRLGGLEVMGQALDRGMVLAMSIWNANDSFMNWLDSGNAGPCSPTEGDPAVIEKLYPKTHVNFSNIRWGDIGSTYKQ